MAVAITVPMSVYYGFHPLHTGDLAVSRQRLSNDLVHVVILVRRQPPNEMDLRRPIRQRLVLCIQLTVLFPRHRIIRIALSFWKFKHDASLRVLLTSQVFEIGRAS